MFRLLRNCQTVFKAAEPFHISTSSVWGFWFLHILTDIYLPLDHSLIALARTSSTTLNKSGRSNHFCPVPDPKRKVFTIKYVICGCFVDAPAGSGSSLLFLDCCLFSSWRGIEFCQMLFLHTLRWSCGFVLCSINTVYYIYCFCILSQHCIPRINPSWSSCLTLFYMLLDSVC